MTDATIQEADGETAATRTQTATDETAGNPAARSAEPAYSEPAKAEPAEAETPEKHRRFSVDLFATSLNDIEVGVMRHTQHRAKSSQFTKDMDVIGQVTEDGRRTGVLAYRAGLWRQQTGAKRRLVIKLFSASMHWRATLDMMIGRSLQLTYGADGVPVTAFSVNVARSDHLIQIERSADKAPFFPEKFSFFVMGDDGARYFKLKKRIFAVGADYTLIDQSDRAIGLIDGKLVNLGGLWKVRAPADQTDPNLDAALQLFCAMQRFNREARAHIRALNSEMIADKRPVALDHTEKDLYLNPRRAR